MKNKGTWSLCGSCANSILLLGNVPAIMVPRIPPQSVLQAVLPRPCAHPTASSHRAMEGWEGCSGLEDLEITQSNPRAKAESPGHRNTQVGLECLQRGSTAPWAVCSSAHLQLFPILRLLLALAFNPEPNPTLPLALWVPLYALQTTHTVKISVLLVSRSRGSSCEPRPSPGHGVKAEDDEERYDQEFSTAFSYAGITPAQPLCPQAEPGSQPCSWQAAQEPTRLLGLPTSTIPTCTRKTTLTWGGTPPTAVLTPLISRTNTPGSSLSREVDFPLITNITNSSWLCRAFITGCMAVGDCFKKLPTHGAVLAEPVPSAVINANNKAQHHAAFYGLSNAGRQSY